MRPVRCNHHQPSALSILRSEQSTQTPSLHRDCHPCRFGIINGVLIPGGAQALTPHHHFYDAVALFVDLAKQAYDQGDYFPVSRLTPVLRISYCMPALPLVAARHKSCWSQVLSVGRGCLLDCCI